jgi:type I restriction enzyme S subunit
MTNSGIPSVGQIPEHWNIERNKLIFREIDERSKTGQEELLTVSHITGITPRSEKEVNMFLAESMEGYKLCSPDDLIINTMWAWMGALGISDYDGIVSPSYNVYRLNQEYIPKYLDLLYRTPAYICEITRYSKGVWTSRLRLYPDEFFEIYTVTPPLFEQQQIVEYIEREQNKIQILSEKLQVSIERLKEYRTALISAAVTGKIDVREAR